MGSAKNKFKDAGASAAVPDPLLATALFSDFSRVEDGFDEAMSREA